MLTIEPDWPIVIEAFLSGKTLAYPTEGVWGLGCDPMSERAVLDLLALKQRPVSKGLIVLASDWQACEKWVDQDAMGEKMALISDWPQHETWVFPASRAVPSWVRGDHSSIAIRMSAHPLAAALTRHCGGLLCSTSANLSGQLVIKDEQTLRQQPLARQCVIVSGDLGAVSGPSPIKDVMTGDYLRL